MKSPSASDAVRSAEKDEPSLLGHFSVLLFLPKMYNLHLIRRKHQADPDWGTFHKSMACSPQKCQGPKRYEWLKNCPRLKEMKETWQLNPTPLPGLDLGPGKKNDFLLLKGHYLNKWQDVSAGFTNVLCSCRRKLLFLGHTLRNAEVRDLMATTFKRFRTICTCMDRQTGRRIKQTAHNVGMWRTWHPGSLGTTWATSLWVWNHFQTQAFLQRAGS